MTGFAIFLAALASILFLMLVATAASLQAARDRLKVAEKRIEAVGELQSGERAFKEWQNHLATQRTQQEQESQIIEARFDVLRRNGNQVALIEDLEDRNTALKNQENDLVKNEQTFRRELERLKVWQEQEQAKLAKEHQELAVQHKQRQADLEQLYLSRKRDVARVEQELQELDEKLRVQRAALASADAAIKRAEYANIGKQTSLKQFQAQLEQQEQALGLRDQMLKQRTREVDTFEAGFRVAEQHVRQQQSKLDQQKAAATQAMQVIADQEHAARAQLKLLEEDVKAMERRLKIDWGGRLICDQCWNTYQPNELLYVPRATLPMVRNQLTDAEKKVAADGFTLSRVQQMVERPAWHALLARERPDLTSSQSQIEALFELRCPARGAEAANNPLALHRSGTDRLTPAELNWCIPMIGNTGTGKTTYVTALLHRLHELSVGYGFDLEAQDVESSKHFRELEKTLFYDYHMSPTQVGTRRDMVYRIRSMSDQSASDVTLFFKDVPGESWRDLQPTVHQSQFGFLLNARTLIFLLDPLADPELLRLVATSQKLPPPQNPLNQQAAILEKIDIFFRQAGGFSDRVPKDILLVITKADLIPELLGVRDEVEEAQPLTQKIIQQRSRHIREVIKSSKAHLLLQQIVHLERKYRSVTFFAVSSLGHTPIREVGTAHTSEAAVIDPDRLELIRVEDPIVWALYSAGVLH